MGYVLAILTGLVLDLAGSVLGAVVLAFVEAVIETRAEARRSDAWGVPRGSGAGLAWLALYAGVGLALGALSLNVLPERVAPGPWGRAAVWVLAPAACGLLLIGWDLVLEHLFARHRHGHARSFAAGALLALAYVAARGAAFRG